MTLAAVPLGAVGYLVGVGEVDAEYAGALALLVPSPVLYGSPFPYVPHSHILGYAATDFVINAALVFVAAGLIAKAYVRFRGHFGLVPFTPVVSLTFAATVLFGAWWRPIVMPLVRLVAGLL